MNWVGIDPGKQGAIALLTPFSLELRQMPLDEEGKWCPWLMRAEVHAWVQRGFNRCAIEVVHMFQGNAAGSSASSLEAYGMWRGIIAQYFEKDHVVLAHSQVWKKKFGLAIPSKEAKALGWDRDRCRKESKQRALTMARARWPDHSFQTKRGRDLDGEAEAALIAVYGRETGL